eukprot:scaffold3218_cov63-Attheya_sp.AAC.1
MFSCAYQSSLSDNASTTSGDKEVHNDDSSQSSSLSSTSANYIYESEDIDFSEEEEDEDMMDNLPPPIDLVKARLLELMMKYSVPLDSYKSFLEWAKLSVNTKYDFDSSKKTFGANIKTLLNHESQARNQPTETILPGRCQLPDVSVYTFPFLENGKYMYSQQMLMANSLWKYDASSEVYGESNTGLWWKEAEENMMLRLNKYDIPNRELHYIAPVTMFIDNTHCDRNGRLQAEPCLSWLPGIGNAGFRRCGTPDSYMSDNYFACLWATTVIFTEFIRLNALECEGPETLPSQTKHYGRHGSKSFSTGSPAVAKIERLLCVLMSGLLVSTDDESHRMSHRYRANTPN